MGNSPGNGSSCGSSSTSDGSAPIHDLNGSIGSGSRNGTLTRLNGIKAKPVAVPILLSHPKTHHPSNHGRSTSLIVENQNQLNLLPPSVHSHSHSLSYTSTDSNVEPDLNAYIPTEL
ncbi:unnamed protein product, partial [Allacma fusca]